MGRIKDNYRTFRVLISIPKEYASFLENGKYKWDQSATVLYLESNKVQIFEEAKAFYGISCNTNNVFRKLFSTFAHFTIHQGHKVFRGQFLSVSSSWKEYRLFDLRNRKLLTVFKDTERARCIVSERNYWKSFLPTVPFVSLNSVIIEEPIIRKESFSSKQVLMSLFSDFRAYFAKPELSISNKQFLVEDQELFLPTLKIHGDLWRSNILFDGRSFYYIDFEHSKINVFFYDIFTFMLMEVEVYSDYTLWDGFVEGRFDRDFSELFSVLGVKYDSKLKRVYFSVFLRCFLSERPSMAGDEHFRSIANRLLETL